jgi:hypothetical protein
MPTSPPCNRSAHAQHGAIIPVKVGLRRHYRGPVRGDDVLVAAEASRGLLEPALLMDWMVAVPSLEMNVAAVVAHAAVGLLWYAVDLWGGTSDDAAIEMAVRADAENEKILTSLVSAARVCAASLDASPAGLRGFHPLGAADASGFAAMACDELLVHSHDAARGLELGFEPDGELAARVLARLFPWHDQGADPWRTLLWANGRVERPGLPSQKGWRWHCAPLSEWDGTPPPLE